MSTDYHDFTSIDTSVQRRREIHVGDIYINAVKCLKCNEVIRSKNRHDFVTCSCRNISVDGGSWYLRRSGKGVEDNTYKEVSVNYKYI